jgi:hypothetical protein
VHRSLTAAKASASFTQRANGDCRRFVASIVSLPKETSAAAYVYDTPRVVRGDLRLSAEFKTLTPPAREKARFGQLRWVKHQLIALLAGPVRNGHQGPAGSGCRHHSPVRESGN